MQKHDKMNKMVKYLALTYSNNQQTLRAEEGVLKEETHYILLGFPRV